MDLKMMKLVTALATAALTSAASAGTAPFSMVSGASAPGIDVSLTIQNSVVPGYDYDFVINNASDKGVVTGVYFEEDWNTKLTGAGTGSGDASLLVASLVPDLAWEGPKSSHTIGQDRVRTWVGRGYVDTYYDSLADGIQAGSSHIFSFTTDTSIVSLSDLEDMLGTLGFGIAIRMQDLLTGDMYAAGWGLVGAMPEDQLTGNTEESGQDVEVTGAPTPTAAFAGLTMLGILGLRRRRNQD